MASFLMFATGNFTRTSLFSKYCFNFKVCYRNVLLVIQRDLVSCKSGSNCARNFKSASRFASHFDNCTILKSLARLLPENVLHSVQLLLLSLLYFTAVKFQISNVSLSTLLVKIVSKGDTRVTIQVSIISFGIKHGTYMK